MGETIKIIHSYPPYYSEKDIAKVYKVFESSGAVLADFTLNEDYRGDGRWLVWLNDYVVFEPIAESEEPDEISDIKNEMERLTGELATLALRVSKLEEPAQQDEKSPQEVRDEIVEKAKADIEGLAINDYDHVDYIRRFTGSNQGPFYKVKDLDLATLVEYIVNRKKKTVVCLLRGVATKTIYARGIVKCAPGDVFNSHIGRAIALRRALKLEVPTEYLSVPNPTEFKIGDIVIRYTWVNTMHPYYTFQIGTETDGKSVLSLDSINSYCTLIDDSHEEGALNDYLA
ncbi:hypothetical protein ERIC1_1c14410 [Paenibacillus larvae subsp. larvae DSM 25719]|uniref:hypothetical protein n=1 Tax=Paenibacillus larvae TaxID=1464 RepID=UPI0003DDE0EF|nr:hypothetical protein [Paenibacillus larvae]ETK27986.1 hypothetical protein ERIC1_1c14410 [Paenibacillus larvae subsp. larvae DSM 25719]